VCDQQYQQGHEVFIALNLSDQLSTNLHNFDHLDPAHLRELEQKGVAVHDRSHASQHTLDNQTYTEIVLLHDLTTPPPFHVRPCRTAVFGTQVSIAEQLEDS
jgi:hypothetical protein